MTNTITLPRAVVEQALEMLNRINAADDDRDFLTEDEAVCTIMAIDELDAAIREALEQPQVEQEPVAWIDGSDLRGIVNGNSAWAHPENQGQMLPLYLAPGAAPYDQTALELCETCGWRARIPGECCLMCRYQGEKQND